MLGSLARDRTMYVEMHPGVGWREDQAEARDLIEPCRIQHQALRNTSTKNNQSDAQDSDHRIVPEVKLSAAPYSSPHLGTT
jgi:hypothetical protein